MDYLPTDIFEDLLSDVVGSKYSGPPLAAADLQVLSGPQRQIDIAKVADKEQRFTHRPILGHRQQYIRDFSQTQASKTYGSTNQSGSQPAFSGIDVKKLHTSGADVSAGSSHGRGGFAAFPGIGTQLADPECLSMIKMLLQYSYNKWRVKDYDVAKPQFWFLFENTSEEYKYYRVKLAQLLKLKNETKDTESQANGHERTAGDVADDLMKASPLAKISTASNGTILKDTDFRKLKNIQTSTVGIQTDLKMQMFNRSLADIIEHPTKQNPAEAELLRSQIIASQHPASSTVANATKAFPGHNRDVNPTRFTSAELLRSQIIASQHPAPSASSTVANATKAFPGYSRDVNPTRFTSGISLQPNFVPRHISAPRQQLSGQSIMSQKTIPCPLATSPNAPLALPSLKLMEAIKSVTTTSQVDSKSSVNQQFSEIDEITKKALQNLANMHVISQEQNRGLEMLKGPSFWFLNEKLSPVYKYYRMKLTELRRARGLSDYHLESDNDFVAESVEGNDPRTLDVEATEPLVSEADHPDSQGSESDRPEALRPEHKPPQLRGNVEQRPKPLGSKCLESELHRSRTRKSEPDKFELLVTCSDDEDSDGGDSSPPFREPVQPQVRASQSHQLEQKLPFQDVALHASLFQDDVVLVTEEDPWKPLEEMLLASEESPFSGKPVQRNWQLKLQSLKSQQERQQNSLELVSDKVSLHPPQEMNSNFTESTSEEAMESTSVKQSPRKRGRLPKGVTVPPKRMHTAKESTVLIKPGSKKPEGSQDLTKTKSKEGTSSIDDKSSPEGASKERGSKEDAPKKTLVRGASNVTPTSTNVAAKKRMTRLNM